MLSRNENIEVGTGPGTTVPTNKRFEIGLATGWNYFANPFAFPIPVSELSLRSGDAADILTYQGSWEPVGSTIEPFTGYIVHAGQSPDTLFIDPSLRGDESGKGLFEEQRVRSAHDLDWAIRIGARKGPGRDDDNVLGVSQTARDDWDDADRSEPPPVWDYVSVHFPHEEWGRDESWFRTDIRSAGTSMMEPGTSITGTTGLWYWRLGLAAATPGTVDLTFQDVASVPSELDVWLHDPATGMWHDLRAEQRFAVVVAGQPVEEHDDRRRASARTLEIRVGPRELIPFTEQPTPEFELSVFPNPFSHSATITYGLPSAAEVSLAVFNALGQRVAQLRDAVPMPAGLHGIVVESLSADGRRLAPGSYILRLQAGQHSRSKLITLSH